MHASRLQGADMNVMDLSKLDRRKETLEAASLGLGRQEWQKHYGGQWARMLDWKAGVRPRHILNPGGIPVSP